MKGVSYLGTYIYNLLIQLSRTWTLTDMINILVRLSSILAELGVEDMKKISMNMIKILPVAVEIDHLMGEEIREIREGNRRGIDKEIEERYVEIRGVLERYMARVLNVVDEMFEEKIPVVIEG